MNSEYDPIRVKLLSVTEPVKLENDFYNDIVEQLLAVPFYKGNNVRRKEDTNTKQF